MCIPRGRYMREVALPEGFAAAGKRCLLHFGAVDWEAVVYINGQLCGMHRGGYTSFTIDATDALALQPGKPATIIVREFPPIDWVSLQSSSALLQLPLNISLNFQVRVWDPTDLGTIPRGKQVRYPHRIWYTSVTGIWQTCWMESVPEMYIGEVRCSSDFHCFMAVFCGCFCDRFGPILMSRCLQRLTFLLTRST